MNLIPQDDEINAWIDGMTATADVEEQARFITMVADKAHSYWVSAPIADTPILYAVSSKVASWDPIRQGGPAYSYQTVRRSS